MIFQKNIYFKILIHTRNKANIPLTKIIQEMSRNRSHLVEAQKQRLRIKEKSSKYVPGTVTIQILGSGAPGSPASVYLFTDQSRYLFNCGEGTQRLAHEHKTKLSRLEHIFLTRTSWGHLGGLPGLSLTVQDAGVPNLTLHGPPGLNELYRGMRRFVILKDLTVDSVNCVNCADFEDQVLSVKAVPIARQNMLGDPTADYSNKANPGNSSNNNSIEEISTSQYEKQEEHVVISYICKLKPRPGSLNLEKCVDKGITPGPILGQLKNGFDVTLPNGTIVKADDVRESSDPGPVFIFIDIPCEDYLESLEKNSILFERHQAKAQADGDQALVVLHFSPNEIVKNPIYQSFISKFSASTKHLVLNTTNKFSGYLAAHRIQFQLNQLNENIFPILSESSEDYDMFCNYKKLKLENETESCDDIKSNETSDSELTENVKSMTLYHLRPRKGLDRSSETSINPPEYVEETHVIKGFKESLNEVKNKLTKSYLENLNHIECEYPKIVFLGTGSCIPNKTRNVSSILVHISETSCILLDCGEGTYGQIVRFYGKTKTVEILKSLKAIYISHLHADHHIGLIGLLEERKRIYGKNVPAILLFAPKQIESWLNFYDYRIDSISQTYNLIPNGDMIANSFSNEYTNEMGLQSISTCLVKHCPHSFGVALEMKLDENKDNKPIKITYSGDTMPCRDLIELGMDSTILIHEATMEDELADEAEIKMHSTTSQAIEQGNKMNAKYIILTHFSQRYAKLPRIEMSINNNVGIAFDNMQVTLKDLHLLNLMYPTMKIMFTEHYEEMENKALKRALKKERKRLSSTSGPVR